MSATRPPLAYLVTCSQMSLESVELSRLNQASNLRKEFQQILEEWIDSEVDARLARSLLEWKRGQCLDAQTLTSQTPQMAEPARFEQLAIAFLPESSASAAVSATKDRPQLQGVDGRTERIARTKRPHSATRICTPDQTAETMRRRPMELAKAAESKLREVEHLAKCFPRSLREVRRRVGTTHRSEVPPGESAVRASRSPSQRPTGAIEFVPRRAGRDEREASALHPIPVCVSDNNHILEAKRDDLGELQTRPASLAPRAMLLSAELPRAHLHARQAG